MGLATSSSDRREGKHPTKEQFAACVDCLSDTLKQLSVAQSMIDEVMAIVLTVRSDILGE